MTNIFQKTNKQTFRPLSDMTLSSM